jgi:hypothetical protein
LSHSRTFNNGIWHLNLEPLPNFNNGIWHLNLEPLPNFKQRHLASRH